MDYQETIKEAEIQIDMYESMILYNRDFEPKNDNSNYERKIDFLKTAISVIQEMQEYKQKLNNAYGECDDLLRTVVDGLVRHEGIEFGTPIKSRILTDDDVDLWEWYKQIGTLEEVREAVEKQKRKKPQAITNRCYVCPHCGLVASLKIKHNYCDACGQHIDWSEVEE